MPKRPILVIYSNLEEIILALKNNDANITHLEFSCLLEERYIPEFAEALKVNTQLLYFSINEAIPELTLHDIQLLVDALLINRTLEEIDLFYSCDLGHEGAKLISKLLMHNNTLKKLDITGCYIGPLGAVEIARALKVNQGLKALCLSINGIKDEGLNAIVEALKTNKTLEHLFVDNNDVSEKMLQSLQDIHQINKTLKQVILGTENSYTSIWGEPVSIYHPK